MDPQANIKEQVSTARAFIELADGDTWWSPGREDVLRLAELVVALDEWRRRGGFDPYLKKEA